MTAWLCWAVVSTAAAQGTSSGKSANTPSKSKLSEIRAIVHDLQGRTDKLRELMSEYRSLVEQRPPANQKEQDERWQTALDRLLRRIDSGRAAVVETHERLKQATTGQLPTTLAKEVANAHNDAEAQRAAAEQALAKNKPRPAKRTKQAQAEEPAKPPIPDDLDDL